MKKEFKDVIDGETFTYNRVQLKKIPTVKISCCRSINAEDCANANNRIFIQPQAEVEVNDQLQ